MDYEKEYKEALERAKESLRDGTITNTAKGYIETIFPELAESEDERIRKALITFFNRFPYDSIEVAGTNAKEALAWLEKQGEKKSVDNVKPKFKVGDWITNGQLTCKVLSVISKSYELHLYNDDYCHFETDVQNVDKDYHLWTIADAKDGDVVVDKSDGTIGIFQSIGHHPDGGSCNDPSYCFLHCRYDDGFFYADFEHGNMIDSDDLIPATKEQRDLLFSKMKEAGYEWDAEKKELRKINQNIAWSEEDEDMLKKGYQTTR